MMPVNSLGGYSYYLTFTDDHSRKTWIYFLKKKDEVFPWFRHFKALIENQTENKIKILRTDNGTEYESNEFHDFCKEAGIKRETTTPYTPEQNGVAKRKNRTIMEAVRAMLHDQSLPKFLWAEVANIAVYVQNRCPHQALGSMSPEEKFTGKKPDVSHLKNFGSPVYFHVPKEKRNKLGASGKKGIFVGYGENTKGYRIYVAGQREVIISHDVTFDEDMALNKVINLPTLRSSQEADTREPKEKDDESMPDVEEPMDPIDPPPYEPSSSRKRPSWLKGLLDDAEGHAAPRGTFRESKKPNRYQGYLTIMSKIIQNEPSSFSDAVKHQVWKDAMTEEYESIIKNDVWEVVPRPQDKTVVTSKWLYKMKHVADGSTEKYKARFVTRGFSQKEGIDYDEIFAPVARYTTIRSIIALAASQGWNLHQMDVKTAFLHGSIKEEVYVEQPEGFEIYDRKSHVCRLKKALYGLKQAPRAWYERIDSYLMKLGFTRSEADPNLYFKVEDDKPLILVLYVDDLFLTGADPLILKCKRELASEFEMKDLGLMHYFLGLEVWQKPGEIFLSQGKYVVKILERFRMVDCKPVTTPMELDFKKLSGSAAGPVLQNATEYRQLVGAIMFLVNSRPDICFAVNTLSQHMVEPHHIHWIGAKNLLRYLRGTITYGLRYIARDVRLFGYTDADWAGNVEDRKSTSGCCFSLGSASISWMSRKQKSVALSTAKAEYIAASMASCEAVWLRKLFSELFGFTLDTIVILCDNQSGIRLSENPIFHDRSKHIDIRYHYIRDMVQRGAIRLHHIGTDEQVADILTKPLGKVKFLTFREQLGVVQRPSNEGHV